MSSCMMRQRKTGQTATARTYHPTVRGSDDAHRHRNSIAREIVGGLFSGLIIVGELDQPPQKHRRRRQTGAPEAAHGPPPRAHREGHPVSRPMIPRATLTTLTAARTASHRRLGSVSRQTSSRGVRTATSASARWMEGCTPVSWQWRQPRRSRIAESASLRQWTQLSSTGSPSASW